MKVTKMVEILVCICDRCEHEWEPRIDPRICPKCKSVKWNDKDLSALVPLSEESIIETNLQEDVTRTVKDSIKTPENLLNTPEEKKQKLAALQDLLNKMSAPKEPASIVTEKVVEEVSGEFNYEYD